MRQKNRILYVFILWAGMAFLLFAFHVKGSGQQVVTLSGFVRDSLTGEELIGATVYLEEIGEGTITNVYGFYSLSVPAGTYRVRFNYLGYRGKQISLVLKKNESLNMEMSPFSHPIDEVVVTGDIADRNVSSSEMSVTSLDTREIKTIPVLFGELDVLKTIQLLPGIQSAGEGNSGFFVRGGDISQNLILLDEAPVYNATHLLGFFSIFNSDAIRDVSVMKGGIPAEYGGRLSSVLDVKMREGNMKKWGVSGGLGLISSKLMVEGPLQKDRGSLIVSARRTYADLFLRLSPDSLIKNNVLYFYDFNLKANYRLGNNDRLYVSGYWGRDVFRFRNYFGFDWGNFTTTLRWNHLFNEKLFLNTSFVYSNYNYVFEVVNEGIEFNLISSIRDWNLKADFQYYIKPGNTMFFGFKSNYHHFLPGEVSSRGDFPIHDKKLETKYAWEHAAYYSHETEWGDILTLKYGLRFSMFTLVGPGNVYRFSDEGFATDTTWYSRGEIIANYPHLDPRLLVTLRTGATHSIKVSYTQIHQYIHQISQSTATTPIDLWIPSSRIVKPQSGRQIAMGYFRNFGRNGLETSVEIYYKHMDHQIEYRNGADILLNDQLESQLVFGRGWSYGLELYVRKNTGKFRGWMSYTLSKTERAFDTINNGDVFPARQDRTHNLSLVGLYDLNDRISLSASWVYYTGNAVTFPGGKYMIDGQVTNYYPERNAYRMPPYHRLDVGMVLENKPGKKYRSSWRFSIYNAYARKNAYSIYFEQDEDNPTVTYATKLYLFSIIPSVSYQFKF